MREQSKMIKSQICANISGVFDDKRGGFTTSKRVELLELLPVQYKELTHQLRTLL